MKFLLSLRNPYFVENNITNEQEDYGSSKFYNNLQIELAKNFVINKNKVEKVDDLDAQ